MEIILNNTPEIIDGKDSLTVNELLLYKKFSFKMLVIKINDKLIKKDEYVSAKIKDKDNVMILHLMSGG